MGKKRTICRECSKAKFPAISAAKLGHEACLVTAYRVLGVFNERDAYGATPIHYAARGGQLDCLKWLIANSGISPVAAAKNGTTAAHDAAAMGHLTCLQHLLENTRCSPLDRTNEGATVLHMACRFGHVAVTRWLIERGLSSPCDKGDNGVTPVHLCAAKNHLDCLKYLTKSPRYLPDQLTVHGATPVYFAAQEGSLECLQWLVEHGNSDPSIFANDGMNPLHAAAQAGELSCMKWLVNHGGVSPRQKAEDGATPMHFAASGGKILCLKWLFENGGSLLDRDDLGGTPLHDAAEQGQIEAVSFILSCGIQKDIPDNEGLTPIDLAKDNNHEECMKLFYIRSPTLLNSLTPQHPQNRASTSEEEMIRREKQRQFEKALLSNTTKEERDDMWKEAKENKPDPQPVGPGPSDSSRRSKNRNSLDAHRLSLSLINDLIDDHASKERPALSPELFLQQPLNDDVKEGDAAIDIVDATSEVEKVVQDILKEINPNQINQGEPDNEGGGQSPTATVEDGHTYHTVSPTAHHLTDVIIDNEEDSNPYDTFFGAPESSKKQKTKSKAAPPKSPLKEQQQLAIPTTHHYQDGIPKEDIKPLSSTTSGKNKSSSTGWKAVLQRLSPRKSKPVVQTPVTTAGVRNSSTPTSSSGSKPKGKKKKGKKNKANHQESTAAGHGKPPDNKSVQKTKTKKGKKQSAEDQTPSTEDVIMRRKPNKNSSDKVFSHRTSKVEEYAIVSQRRTSTNDEEVAVKFESRPIASRQSRLSTLSDDMSSPESSSDEHNHDNEDNMDEDIFSPISRTGFNKFGEPIEEDEREGDGLLLENTGSLASLDTMIVHEDEVDEAINVLQNTGSLKDLQVEEQEVEVEVEDDQPVVAEADNDVEQSMESSELRPSPSPNKRERKQMMLIPEEDEDEEDFEGESEDTLAPLPSIINSSYHIDNSSSSRDELTMDRFGETNSPTGTDEDHYHNESTELNPDVVIKIESVPGFPMASNQGVRSFALVKQMYDSQGGGGVSTPSRSLSQRRHSPVFSPLMVVATVSPRTSLTSVKEEDVSEVTSSGGNQLPTVEENTNTTDDNTEQTSDEIRISLTPSQEAAFDNLEKLKDSLMSNDEIKEEETQQENDENTVTAKDHKQALRTSPAVEELSNMIKGLDDLMEEKRKQPISEPPSDGRGNVNSPDKSGSGLDRNGTGNYLDGGCHVNNVRDDVVSEDISVMGSDIQSLSSTPRQNPKHDVDHDYKKDPPTAQLGVNVEIDGFERVQLTVKSSLLVISLIFKAAEVAGVELTKYHTLFEVNNSLRIERPLEDHESVGEIMSKWPKKNPPHFHLHTYHEKYLLWEKNPLPKGYVGQFLKQGKTPNISSSLHFCKGVSTGGMSSSKGKWLNGTHCLGSLGIYQINAAPKSSSSTGSSSMDLVCGTDQLLYLPLHTSGSSVDWHRYKPLPSKHCFVLKPGSLWREKDMKIFCCDDYQSYSQWVSGIRLVKYGLQLKCNYVAMCKRLEQLPAPAATTTST